MPVDPLELRIAMRRWLTGVTIVAVDYQGVKHGMTVSSFTSVSLAPPVVTVSLERSTRTHELLMKAGVFALTILSGAQQDLSERFGGVQSEHQDRFAGLVSHTLLTGAPFLPGGMAYLDCRVIATHHFGTNTLFLAEVLAAQAGEGRLPLIYYNQQYHRLQE